MATTTPDSIRTPNPSDPYNLISDLGIMANDTQAALVKRANLYVGTSTQRTAFTTAPEGTWWQDTNGDKNVWARKAGAWVNAISPTKIATGGGTQALTPGNAVMIEEDISSYGFTETPAVTVLSNAPSSVGSRVYFRPVFLTTSTLRIEVTLLSGVAANWAYRWSLVGN